MLQHPRSHRLEVLISPAKLPAEPNVATDLLERHEPQVSVSGRPQLRVIQGGLA
jgi:hypothetical protein